MSTAAPTFSQIRAQVAAIRRHAKNSRVFGIYSPVRWNGESRQSFGDELYHIVQCDSPLALRVALQERTDDSTANVLVTRIPTETLSADIRIRLARRKLYPIKNWQIVKELFQAKQLDPRIVEHNWIAERLLDLAPPEEYPPVPSGVLDAETVWGILLEHDLGLVVARPDLIALLKWSVDADNVWHRNGKLLEEEGHVTDLLTHEATRWIKQRGDQPFFLYVPFTAVHLPINEPQEWLARVPDSITSEIVRQYAACVMHLDDLETDPRKGNDLAARQSERLDEMMSELSVIRQRDSDAAVDQ